MEHGSSPRDDTPPMGGDVGWYRHPTRTLEHRYWDGVRWRRPAPAPDELAGRASRRWRPTDPTGREPVTAGELWWDPATDRLTWSTETALLHGYRGSPPALTRELMLSHVVDADRAAVTARFVGARRHAAPLQSHHRMRGADGSSREVVLVAAVVETAAGGADGSADGGDPDTSAAYHGFLVDVGHRLAEAAQAAVEAAREGNGAVQRAVGVLCVSLGIDSDAALAALRRASTDHNVKMRDLAQQVVDVAAYLSPDDPGRSAETLAKLLRRPARDRTRGA